MTVTYTPANTKPDKLLTGFISVRAPELKHIYTAIQSATSVDELVNKFGLPTANGPESDHIEDTVRFLNAVDLVEALRRHQEYSRPHQRWFVRPTRI